VKNKKNKKNNTVKHQYVSTLKMPAKTKPNVLVAAGGKEDTMRGACLTVTTGDFFFSTGGAGLAAMSAHPLGAVFFFSFGEDFVCVDNVTTRGRYKGRSRMRQTIY
jgi:hypothetical protein